MFTDYNNRSSRGRKHITTKFEPSDRERLDILKQANEQAFLLYQYYLRMASIGEQSMEDSAAAEYFNWSTRKVATARKALEKLGYFKRIIYTSSTGKKSVTYYVDKETVINAN